MKLIPAVFLLYLSVLPVQSGSPPGRIPPGADTASARRIAWWREGRFGMFIHWGPVSLKGTEISWSRGGPRRGIEGVGEIPLEVYDNLYKEFNPVRFNAAEWVAVAEAAGMRYMVLTAKHCDGFCLWRTHAGDYHIGNTPFGRDVCGELADAAHRRDMRIGWYYSPMDWRDPDSRTPRNTAYVARMQTHLTELLSNYGRIDLLWFDTDGGPAPWDQENTYRLVRTLQPGIVVNNRLDMGSIEDYNQGRIGPHADYYTPEQRVGAFDDERPWETCMTLGTQWSWKPDDSLKTAAECIRLLVRCVSGDGNLLLNVGPMPNGGIEPRQEKILKEVGRWLDRYGESIYGTRGGPFRLGERGGATRKGNVLYLHVFQWNGRRIVLPNVRSKILRASLLKEGPVEFLQRTDSLSVFVPPERQRDPDTIVKLELSGSAD